MKFGPSHSSVKMASGMESPLFASHVIKSLEWNAAGEVVCQTDVCGSSLVGIYLEMYSTIFMNLAFVLSGIFRLFFVRRYYCAS